MKAGCYYRVSTFEQSKRVSPEMQTNRCHALAESKGWELATEFDDFGLSGRTKDRPGLKAMLEAPALSESEPVASSVDNPSLPRL